MPQALAVLLLAFGWVGLPQTAVPPAAPPKTYNERADARQVIAAAVKSAATDDIRVLVNWGANDCDACAAYLKVQNSPDVAPELFSDEYRRVYVDVGHLDKNLDLAKQYGVKLDTDTLPVLTVLDRDGKVIASISARDLRAANSTTYSGPLISSFLIRHQAPAPNDTVNFQNAVAKAKHDGKLVFVWFSAPW